MFKAIHDELIDIFKKDQFLLKTPLSEFKKYSSIHAIRLAEIIKELNSWPSAELVGSNGELAAWLIAQHAPELNFQQECLRLLRELPQTEERKEHTRYLTDRILIKQGNSQKYGTQLFYQSP